MGSQCLPQVCWVENHPKPLLLLCPQRIGTSVCQRPGNFGTLRMRHPQSQSGSSTFTSSPQEGATFERYGNFTGLVDLNYIITITCKHSLECTDDLRCSLK